jgi:hypothetical protein
MTVLIVGADRIGSFVPKLEQIGVDEVIHWSGRSQKVAGYDIPARAELVIFCTDFLHHTAARTLKKKIKEKGVPAVYCRRAWSEIGPKVAQFIQAGKNGSTSKKGDEIIFP